MTSFETISEGQRFVDWFNGLKGDWVSHELEDEYDHSDTEEDTPQQTYATFILPKLKDYEHPRFTFFVFFRVNSGQDHPKVWIRYYPVYGGLPVTDRCVRFSGEETETQRFEKIKDEVERIWNSLPNRVLDTSRCV